ncbi:MAG: hypothetical protein ABDK94_10725, partial [Atribacterota bacterium]
SPQLGQVDDLGEVVLGIIFWIFRYSKMFFPSFIHSPSLLAFQHAKRFDMVVTGASLSVIPVMIIFALAQRQMVKGVTLTGMKI